MNRTYTTFGPQGWGTYEVDLAANQFTPSADVAHTHLVPGFIDVHIHGAFGVDFLSASSDDMTRVVNDLENLGYEALLPTTVTAPPSVVSAFLRRLPTHRAIAGFHLEGPFISPLHPGAQPPSAISTIPSDDSEWDPIFDDPRFRLITLAPELVGAETLIRRLTSQGVIVSMGHTDATFEQVQRAVEWGVSHATHTYNAMRGLHHREAGTVGGVMLQDQVLAELIYDRLHVSKPAAQILINQKTPARVVAVSDATMAAGMDEGTTFDMWGLRCIVGHQQVRLENGTLAGSGITLADAFRNLWDDFGPVVAVQAASLNPRRELNMGLPQVWLELDHKLDLLDIYRLSQ